MTSLRTRLLGVLGLGLGLGLCACGNDFPPVSAVQGVRVLAVRPTAPSDDAVNVPASGLPGDLMTLEMLYTDGRVAPGEPPEPSDEPPLAPVWLGGCHNPESRLYYGCLPALRETAERLAAGDPVPPGIFGLGSPFTLPLPDDILTGAPRIASDPFHFGVSFVFFGLCAGKKIVARPDRTEGIPLDCVDESGAVLGAHDFVVGFTTLYTYEGVQNLNPVIPSVRFDGNPVTGPECEGGTCPAPIVAACGDGDDCPAHQIIPEVSAESFERLPDGTNEILWASYYATGGGIAKESQLVADRTTGRVDDFSSGWRAPATPGRVRLWVTLNDERGGAHWASFDIEVQ